MSCKVWRWILYPSDCSLGIDYEALLESRKSIGRAFRLAHHPQKPAVLCRGHIQGGNELLEFSSMHHPALLASRNTVIYEMVCTRVGKGGHSCVSGKLFMQHHKVWLQSHTLVPELDLNQPAWEMRVMQVQPKRINPWFKVPKEDREGLTTLDDALLFWLLCHQCLGCARDACTVFWQMGCSYIWGPNASLGNAACTLFPFSGARLAHWWWGRHKVLPSVQLLRSTRGT